MTTPRSAAEEARDPSTDPDRLLELTRKHPQLQGLIVTNPSAPQVAREWILATNPWAKRLYEQQQAAPTDQPDDGEAAEDPDDSEAAGGFDDAPTAAMPVAAPGPVPDTRSTSSEPDADPDGASVWGDVFDQPPKPAPTSRPAATSSSSGSSSAVHVAPDRGVVPLGAAGAGGATAPGGTSAGAVSGGTGPVPSGPPTTPMPRVGPSPASAGPTPAHAGSAAAAGPHETEQGSGRNRRRIWLACGGCLILALLLLLVAVLGVRAWLAPDDDAYQRPTSEPAAEQTEEPTEEEATEEPAEDPVSPAPEGALELTEIASPTGNITCSLEGESAGCSLADRDYSDAGLEDCSEGPFSIRVAGDAAEAACGQTFGEGGAPTLEYGDSAVNGDVACSSESEGMTCWNTRTGQGFFVNRATYETF